MVFCLQTNNLVFLSNNLRLLLSYLFRWANQGLDFLTVACDPKTLTALSESEFQVIIFISVFIVYFFGGGRVWGSSSNCAGTFLYVRDVSISVFSNLQSMKENTIVAANN